MEQWIVVFTMLNGRYATGHFPTEESCLRWFHHWQGWVDVNMPGAHWLGTCYTEGEFKQKFPMLKLAEEN